MDVLKRSLKTVRGGDRKGAAGEMEPGDGKKSGSARAESAGRAEHGKAAGERADATADEDLSQLSKAELYKRATGYAIAHRSTMNRAELEDAVRKATRGRDLRSAS